MGSILIVEADPVISDQWSAAVSEAGHVVLTATAMRDALPLLRDGGIDAVVLSAYDPRVGVVQLAQNIAALPDAPPVVLVSASPYAPELSARIGASAFVPKPCEPAEIVSAISRMAGALRPVKALDDEPTGRSSMLKTFDDEPTGRSRPLL